MHWWMYIIFVVCAYLTYGIQFINKLAGGSRTKPHYYLGAVFLWLPYVLIDYFED